MLSIKERNNKLIELVEKSDYDEATKDDLICHLLREIESVENVEVIDMSSRSGMVIEPVADPFKSREVAIEKYKMSMEEIEEWQSLVDEHEYDFMTEDIIKQAYGPVFKKPKFLSKIFKRKNNNENQN